MAIFQLITSEETELPKSVLQIRNHFWFNESQSGVDLKEEEKDWIQISNCPVGATRPSIPTLV